MGKAVDLTGEKFGKLLVLRRGGYKSKVLHWVCKCDCGGKTLVRTNNLTTGHTKSCGCVRNRPSQESPWHTEYQRKQQIPMPMWPAPPSVLKL